MTEPPSVPCRPGTRFYNWQRVVDNGKTCIRLATFVRGKLAVVRFPTELFFLLAMVHAAQHIRPRCRIQDAWRYIAHSFPSFFIVIRFGIETKTGRWDSGNSSTGQLDFSASYIRRAPDSSRYIGWPCRN